MAPEHAYFVAALDGDDFGGDGLLVVGLAGHVRVVDILDGVVGERRADSYCEAIVGTVDTGWG